MSDNTLMLLCACLPWIGIVLICAIMAVAE